MATWWLLVSAGYWGLSPTLRRNFCLKFGKININFFGVVKSFIGTNVLFVTDFPVLPAAHLLCAWSTTLQVKQIFKEILLWWTWAQGMCYSTSATPAWFCHCVSYMLYLNRWCYSPGMRLLFLGPSPAAVPGWINGHSVIARCRKPALGVQNTQPKLCCSFSVTVWVIWGAGYVLPQ